MIKFENVVLPSAEQWRAIIASCRNPTNSWNKSDSEIKYENVRDSEGYLEMGPNDHTLMMKLRNAGTDHRKFMRMITVYMGITAPLYWWKEFDTYKVGTVANSCSTMHKIADKEFTLEDFSCEHLLNWNDDFTADCVINYHHTPDGYPAGDVPLGILRNTVKILNKAREKYLEAKTKPMKEEAK